MFSRNEFEINEMIDLCIFWSSHIFLHDVCNVQGHKKDKEKLINVVLFILLFQFH